MHVRHAVSWVLMLTAMGFPVESAVADEVKVEDQLPAGAVGRFRTLQWKTAAAISPDGKILAVAGRVIALTDLETGKVIGRFEKSSDEVEVLLLSFPDQKTLVSVDSDGIVRSWSLEKKAEARPAWKAFVSNDDWCPQAALSPGGDLLLAHSEGTISVWDLNRQMRLHQFQVTKDYGSPFALAPDGNTIAVNGGKENDGVGIELVLLDAATGKGRAKSNISIMDYYFDIRFSPDGKTIATVNPYSLYRVWDAATLREKFNFRQLGRVVPQLLAFSPNSQALATTHGDGFLRLRNLQTQQEICRLPLRVDGRWVNLPYLFFSPDGQRIIAVDDRSDVIRICNATTGRELTDASQPQPSADPLGASPDGKLPNNSLQSTRPPFDN